MPPVTSRYCCMTRSYLLMIRLLLCSYCEAGWFPE